MLTLSSKSESSAKLIFKIFVFCFALVCIQTALITGFEALPINLAFAAIMVFASLFGLYENLILSSFLCIFITLISYKTQVFWFYPAIAIVASRINTIQIADKLLLCIIFNIVFTPLLEIFNPSSSSYLDKVLTATLSNILCSIVLFFVVKLLFIKK